MFEHYDESCRSVVSIFPSIHHLMPAGHVHHVLLASLLEKSYPSASKVSISWCMLKGRLAGVGGEGGNKVDESKNG